MFTLVLQQFKGDFLRRLLLIALPISIQSMMFSSRSLVDILMLGQLGQTDVAAMGIAGRAIFVATIMLFGVTTGGALLTAQYWGAGNSEGVKRSTALTWLMSNITALIAAGVFFLSPESVISLATNNSEVVALGAQYLQITALSMFPMAFGISMAVGLRSMHQPGVSTFFSAIGISLNILLNWLLIFGKWGFPEMGIAGAAWATVISGVVEVSLLYAYLYHRKHLLSFGLSTIIAACEWIYVKRFLTLSLPTTFNHLAWSAGIFVYHAIIGQYGVEGLAALSVMTPIESLSLAFLIGSSNAAAVMIGNQLGANKMEEAYHQAWAVSCFNLLSSIVMAILMLLIKEPVLNLFTALTPETRALTEQFFVIYTGLLIIKSIPMTMIVGILRAGGDIRFCFYQDIIAQWVIGIPIVAICALVFKIPVEWIYALLGLEELVKWVGSTIRLRSKKWMNNLVA
ncbi:MATE family efflux transporter [Photobacterium damselae]|uniref:MATE family efflux transporter n=1 Tax=Photobacterium damselae TaxID=38293 RepID=A0ACD3T3E4_PHODM|nr:MATE family efflux transporter [Photobacterium damselae]RDL29512.1 MATE family efflux transporter [Photobacterium damselae]TMX52640.1 MATE family efflux transporter [Photobacterium damselae]TMX69854.1 MATE family efflux transporter [Photobacterium damselae]TMX77711.1 MATE family efflux transporter [Photobacterium damselae]